MSNFQGTETEVAVEQERRVLFDVLLRRRLGREDFAAWFSGMQVHEATDRLILLMTSKFHINWVEAHFRDDILAAAQAAWPTVREVYYILEKSEHDERGRRIYRPDTENLYPKRRPPA